MKQTFKVKNGYIWNIIYFLVAVGIMGYFVINSGQALDWSNPVLSIGIVCIFIIVIILSNRGVLELNDGILSRKRFFIQWWSVSVSSITDILQGNTITTSNLHNPGNSYSSKGLTFRDTQSKFYQIPYDLIDQNNLINILKQIQPSVQYHSDPTNFLGTPQLTGDIHLSGSGWKGDTRLKKTKIFILVLVLIVVAVLAILGYLK